MSLNKIISTELVAVNIFTFFVNIKIIRIAVYLILLLAITLLFSGCFSQSPSETEIKMALGGDKISELVIRKISKVGRIGDGPVSPCHGGFGDPKDLFLVELSYTEDLGPCSSSRLPALRGRTCGPLHLDGMICIKKDNDGNWYKATSIL